MLVALREMNAWCPGGEKFDEFILFYYYIYNFYLLPFIALMSK